MAETVSKASTVTHVNHGGEVTVTVIEQTTVWSISGARFDVSILDDFMAALADADAPKNAPIGSSHTGEGRLTQLRAQWESERRVTPEAGDE